MEMLHLPGSLLVRVLHFGVIVVPLFLVFLMHTQVLLHPDRSLSKGQVVLAARIHYGLVRILVLAWITGSVAVYLAASAPGVDMVTYFSNPKLRAKVLVVIVLSLNAVLLHYLVISRLRVGYVFSEDRLWVRCVGLFLGSVSTASWLFAYLLGLGRAEWSYRHSITTFALWWGLCVLVSCVVGGIHLYRHHRPTAPKNCWQETRSMLRP